MNALTSTIAYVFSVLMMSIVLFMAHPGGRPELGTPLEILPMIMVMTAGVALIPVLVTMGILRAMDQTGFIRTSLAWCITSLLIHLVVAYAQGDVSYGLSEYIIRGAFIGLAGGASFEAVRITLQKMFD
ncbi:MAG: hypothetical protein ABJN42_13795 [Roseibium sp.]|uniref:hypothetical protein n=1 Tax=Roseibium sp. TaxID=1936156 RepID=UPI00329817B9